MRQSLGIESMGSVVSLSTEGEGPVKVEVGSDNLQCC